MPGQVGGRGAQDAAARGDLVGNQVRFQDLAHADVEVEVLGDQVDAAVQQFQPDFERGMALAQQGQRRAEVVAPEPQAGADAQQAPWLRACAANRFQHAFDVIQDLLRPQEGRFTVGAHADTARGAVEQFDAEHGLEGGDALAHMRGGQAHLVGAGAKAGAPGHGAEQA